ncbi:hypothetical protein I3760_04G037100 [Carya illinoinensis]|nr:hypothetical protein I3760_04G037100 [Carya illinoinensis]
MNPPKSPRIRGSSTILCSQIGKLTRYNTFFSSLGPQKGNQMALTNFILTVAGVSAAILLLRSDVKQSAAVFRRNVKHIRHWLEEESASASKAAEKATPKELESKVPPKDKW